MDLSLYTGWQTAPHSRLKGDAPFTGDSYNGLIGWDGKSFSNPPYYGLRGTWWKNERIGFGLEFTHTKVYADDGDAAKIGFSNFEFSDGLNILTANATRRWQNQWRGLSPYVGGGLGVAIPHVEGATFSGSETFEYQLAGPAARLYAGASYDLSERVAVFGEYQFTYSHNQGDLEDGGTFETNIKTNALNVGLTLKF
ncbi:hypothetical protein P775_17640 [Puniceibacterium antarcticum]|uniref:Uncharacterized protein n=2 Tax=Puniceibacterium antarcticum TaxID=1206336 RepID=A0A2G8RBC5_9RHOB|nr:hypothetical protein P775_17640 [Puniceibacterium antarcticum]